MLLKEQRGLPHQFAAVRAQVDQAQESDHQIALAPRTLVFCFRGDLDLAIPDYTHAISLDADYSNAYNNRGNLYRQQRRYDLAIADFTAAIRINPDYAVAYNNRGRTYQPMGDMTHALDDYEQARRIEPDNPAYQGIGMRQ